MISAELDQAPASCTAASNKRSAGVLSGQIYWQQLVTVLKASHDCEAADESACHTIDPEVVLQQGPATQLLASCVVWASWESPTGTAAE